MQSQPGDVRIVASSWVPEAPVAKVLAQAFAADPHTTGMLARGRDGRPDQPERRLEILFRLLLADGVAGGGAVDLAIDARDRTLLGVALWEPPGFTLSPWRPLTGLPTYVRAFGTRILQAARTDRSAVQHRPAEAHWYLHLLGASPAARGRGVGGRLLRHGLARADEAGLGVYLESSTPENVPFYEKFGLVSRGPVPAYGTADPIGMWRDPGTPSA